jgi:short-subunit dehydrogenase
MDLRNAHVVITGGSKGIGAAVARELTKRGARATLVARPSPELEATAAETGSVAMPTDLSDLDQVDGLIARAEERSGPVDILINNAGLGATQHFATVPPETVRNVLLTNLVAAVELSHQALPGMLDRDRGAILNVSSVVGELPMPHLTCYGTTKAGLSAFTLLAQRDIRDSEVNLSVFVLGAVPGTQIHDEGIKDEVVSAVADKLGDVSDLTPEAIAARMADSLEKDFRGTVPMPRSSAPLVAWRRAPNWFIDLIFSRGATPKGLVWATPRPSKQPSSTDPSSETASTSTH